MVDKEGLAFMKVREGRRRGRRKGMRVKKEGK